MGWRGWTPVGTDIKRKLTLGKRHFFVIEEYVEDVKQGEESVPDLVESIMKGSGLAKEELWRILFKLTQFGPEITKIRVSTFWMSGKSTDSRRRPTQPASPVSFNHFRPELTLPDPNQSKKCGF